MLDKTAIRLAIRNQLFNNIDQSVLPYAQDRCAFENRDFEPPDPKQDDPTGAAWLEEQFHWGMEDQKSYGYLELIAIAQYDVCCPVNVGTEIPESIAKAIGAVLKHGTGFMWTSETGETAQISIIRTEVQPGMKYEKNNGVWYRQPVFTTFRAYGLND